MKPRHPGQRRERVVGRVAAEQPDRPRVAADQAEQHPQRRRLARTVGTQKAVHIARRNSEANLVDRGQFAIALNQTAHHNRLRRVHVCAHPGPIVAPVGELLMKAVLSSRDHQILGRCVCEALSVVARPVVWV
jgi:hypothetical protein